MTEEIVEALISKMNEENLLERGRSYIIAIDGRCASGKTTLAQELARRLSCSVIHMDHFFLQPGQRTRERLEEPGGNVDRERFKEEVMEPLRGGEEFSYRIFDCRVMDFCGSVRVKRTPVVIVEGAYSCHPEFAGCWDLTVFLSVDRKEQLRRIEKRNGKKQARQFIERWIPLEERYFAAFGIENKCDITKTPQKQ